MRLIVIYFCLLLCVCINGHAQRVQLNDKVRERNTLKVSIAAVLDTVDAKPVKIHLDLFANASFDSSFPSFLDRNKDGWFLSPLINGPILKKGIHSFLIKFPDSCIRVYQCFVTAAIKNDAKNMIERQYLQSEKMYETILNFLKNKISRTDSLLMTRLLPIGLKAALCMDFFGKDQICVTSQYLFAAPGAATTEDLQFFFRSFFRDAGIPAMDALLSLGWQLKPEQFNRLPTTPDVFNDYNSYKSIAHSNNKIREKIIIGYKEDEKGFSRILLFINN